MRTRLVLCLLLLSSVAAAAKQDVAETAYQEARTAYYALKGDAARRKLRHHWLSVAHRFEAVASEHPKSTRAPDALFTAGELMNELSRISFLPEDQQAAVTDYTKLMESHPRHRLADDAAFYLARIYLERQDQPEAARRVLTDSLAVTSKGDRSREIKDLLASLPAAKAPPARKPTAPAVAEAPVSRPDPSTPSLVDAISKASTPKPAPEPIVVPVKLSEPTVPATASVSPAPAPVSAPPTPAPVTAPPASPPAVAVAPPKPSAPQPKPVAETPAAPATASLDKLMSETRLKSAAKMSRQTELTLVEQLGLKVRRVVIDPGHGGHDTGAIGHDRTREKDITLAISLKLAAELRERGLEVLLTREEDRYVRLEDRAAFANEARGDLFISIHCNSATNRKLRGVETYTLNLSSDRYSIRLAARENATTEKGISDLQFILADLATKANTGESTRLASQVQKSLVGQLSKDFKGTRDLGTKEALFYVLLGAKMPAILVETAFLSHAEDEKRLASPEYQDTVAQSIAQGVEDFLNDRNRLAKIN
ncbi:N-acetylmuramoyl-L-alanine amidase [Stigmatella sp. ncwal1]|uniref:N-acetylmuramoyl-L-alanine amidase n=1 Tax=Stigmatella ashevillensis TaxID=2995309 RepID=A0ABT5D1Y5_9BACT|nr:N-acetylmuramoyl-L-alanine amidase [Stigmatella ashevillena]MDC0707670.1 N-acetylmuramoyl-L-alanine amidase [Stigmatella ashevillena]